jgi:hypothetical protein
MIGAKCKNCGNPVGADGKLFAEVFVCPTCYAIAERVFERGAMLLRRISVLLRDTIRYALMNGKLDFSSASAEKVGDGDLLRRIVGLYTEKEWLKPTPATSSRNSPPSAPDAVNS